MLESAYFVTFSNSICVTWFMIYYYKNGTRFLLQIFETKFSAFSFSSLFAAFFSLAKFILTSSLPFFYFLLPKPELERDLSSLCGLFHLLLIILCFTFYYRYFHSLMWRSVGQLLSDR